MSPVGVSLTEPVTLNGPPNSFCSALSVRSHLSSMLEMSAPTDKRYRMGGEQKVTVQHVTVNEGGQAIVGNVRHGGGPPPKTRRRPHEPDVFLLECSSLLSNLETHARTVQGPCRPGLDCLSFPRSARGRAEGEAQRHVQAWPLHERGPERAPFP
jgi:hypothetical protein